jgi:hypothetical protein
MDQHTITSTTRNCCVSVLKRLYACRRRDLVVSCESVSFRGGGLCHQIVPPAHAALGVPESSSSCGLLPFPPSRPTQEFISYG